MDNFRSVYALFLVSSDVRSISGGCYDDSSPDPRPVSVETEETGASSQSVSAWRYLAAAQWSFFDGKRHKRMRLSNEIDFVMQQVQ